MRSRGNCCLLKNFYTSAPEIPNFTPPPLTLMTQYFPADKLVCGSAKISYLLPRSTDFPKHTCLLFSVWIPFYYCFCVTIRTQIGQTYMAFEEVSTGFRARRVILSKTTKSTYKLAK
ncbi:hypothetical protein CEXT_765531, partial [Caerostris extrusa]